MTPVNKPPVMLFLYKCKQPHCDFFFDKRNVLDLFLLELFYFEFSFVLFIYINMREITLS